MFERQEEQRENSDSWNFLPLNGGKNRKKCDKKTDRYRGVVLSFLLRFPSLTSKAKFSVRRGKICGSGNQFTPFFRIFFMKFVEMQLGSPFPLISQDSGGLGCHARQITSITRSGLPCPLTSSPDHSHQMLNTRCPSSGSPDHNHRILNTRARFTLTRPHCL